MAILQTKSTGRPSIYCRKKAIPTRSLYEHSEHINSFKHISKELANIYKSLGSQFLRAITEMQLTPDNLDESRSTITYLTI